MIPKLIYGTAWKKEKTAEFVFNALTAGFRAIDTACQPKHYNEAGVGAGLELAYKDGLTRKDIFIQTKFTPFAGQDPHNVPYNQNAEIKDQVLQSFEVSTKNLKTDYLDSLVLHSPIFPFAKTIEAWQTFEELHNAKCVKFLGISNCYDLEILQKLYNDAIIKPTFLQNRFYDQSGYDIEIREFCKQNSIKYQSFWTLTANPHILATEQIKALSLKYQKTPQQVFFRFITQIDIIPLIGSTSKVHLLQDLDIFEFELDSFEINTVNQILKNQIKFN